jgi:hypothetical protein
VSFFAARFFFPGRRAIASGLITLTTPALPHTPYRTSAASARPCSTPRWSSTTCSTEDEQEGHPSLLPPPPRASLSRFSPRRRRRYARARRTANRAVPPVPSLFKWRLCLALSQERAHAPGPAPAR